MSEVVGSGTARLPGLTIAPVTPADAYFGIAQQLMKGARALESTTDCSVAFAFVCGHITECLLKAFLAWNGVAESALKQVSHDLSKLRSDAAARGLAVASTEREWLPLLSSLHDRPFHLRYPVGLHILVTPAAQPMLADLSALLARVESERR